MAADPVVATELAIYNTFLNSYKQCIQEIYVLFRFFSESPNQWDKILEHIIL